MGELNRHLIELKWTLGGLGPVLAPIACLQGVYMAPNEALAANRGDSQKRTQEEREAFKCFKMLSLIQMQLVAVYAVRMITAPQSTLVVPCLTNSILSWPCLPW